VKHNLRLRVVLAAAATVGGGLIVLVVAFNLLLDSQLESDANHVLRSRADAQIATLSAGHHGLKVEEAPVETQLDGRTWVFSRGHALERPRVTAPIQGAAQRMSNAPGQPRTDVGDTRLLAAPVVFHGSRLGTVVAAVSLAPYEKTERFALIASVALALVLMAMVILLARRSVTVALQPVKRMTEQAATWSEQDLHRRFAMGPARDELTALAATLDGLLGRVDASLSHEQRFSAEVAHELRTPLARQRSEAELALRQPGTPEEMRSALTAVLEQIDRMTVIIDTLVAAAQAEANPRRGVADARDAARAAMETLSPAARENGVELAMQPALDPVEVDVDRDYVMQVLHPLIDNAVQYGKTRARVAWERHDGHVAFTVTDDGPGLSADELERVFNPGARGRAGEGRPGAGLGLPLARRLARSVGGDVVVSAERRGGSFTALLPAS
jgi:signal transduction histidine kinase